MDGFIYGLLVFACQATSWAASSRGGIKIATCVGSVLPGYLIIISLVGIVEKRGRQRAICSSVSDSVDTFLCGVGAFRSNYDWYFLWASGYALVVILIGHLIFAGAPAPWRRKRQMRARIVENLRRSAPL